MYRWDKQAWADKDNQEISFNSYIIYHYISSATKFLPPYSPDLSPIELCWSKLKEILRSTKTRIWDDLDEAITRAVNIITDEKALNWFNHCGLFFEPI